MTRHDERPVYALGGNAINYERLSAAFPGNVLRSVIIHEPPGFRSEPMAHEGEEMFFILEGALTVEIDGERTILEAGDSMHFPSTRIARRHGTTRSSDAPCCTPARWTCSAMERRVASAETSMAVSRANGRKSAPKAIAKIIKGKSS